MLITPSPRSVLGKRENWGSSGEYRGGGNRERGLMYGWGRCASDNSVISGDVTRIRIWIDDGEREGGCWSNGSGMNFVAFDAFHFCFLPCGKKWQVSSVNVAIFRERHGNLTTSFSFSLLLPYILTVVRVRNTETLDSRPTEYSVLNFSAEKFSVSVEYRDSEKSSIVNNLRIFLN